MLSIDVEHGMHHHLVLRRCKRKQVAVTARLVTSQLRSLLLQLCGAALLGVGLYLLLEEDPSQFFDWFDDIGLEDSLSDPLIVAAVYCMISVGALLFVVGFFGCCGACKESKCMLTTVR